MTRTEQIEALLNTLRAGPNSLRDHMHGPAVRMVLQQLIEDEERANLTPVYKFGIYGPFDFTMGQRTYGGQ